MFTQNLLVTLVNHKAVCRTAQATPALSVSKNLVLKKESGIKKLAIIDSWLNTHKQSHFQFTMPPTKQLTYFGHLAKLLQNSVCTQVCLADLVKALQTPRYLIN